ncbi:MAG: DUF899 family protein [Balneolaceae bacterium]
MKKEIALPEIVTRNEWIAERKALLEEEKKSTRLLDEVRARRRRLPMVKVEKEYKFEGPEGSCRFIDLFEGRRQLYVHHFMWFEEPDKFCGGCSLEADQNYNEYFFYELKRRNVALVAIARAPLERIEEEKTKKGWNFPFLSSRGSDFNYDFQATVDSSRNSEYNYDEAENIHWLKGFEGDLAAKSIFIRDDEQNVYHAYSAYTRGLDLLATHYNYLDLTPYGRQEAWEDSPEGWPQKPTYE